MRKLFITLLSCWLCIIVFAQQTTVSGRITDQDSKPIAGATIRLAGTNTASAISDQQGDFTLKISGNSARIIIQAIGFADQEINASSGRRLTVQLKPSAAAQLEEVIVTGYSKDKRSQFSGAASTIGSKSIETVPVGSFDQALQGRAPGMLVNSGSGQPGSSPTITIRGFQSIQGAFSQPLYVIDGVPAPAGDFQSMNPNDFESITVLKDANAAALYGARAGTGVIVITTKRGKAGVTNFQYRTQVGFTQRPNFERANLMNTAEMLAFEERERIANTPGWVFSPLNPAIPAGMTAARKQQILDSIRLIDFDYANVFYRQGLTQSHELNMSGGSEKTKFFLSASYFNQEGIDLGSALKRYTTRFNVDHTAEKLTVGLSATIGYSQSNFAEGEELGNNPRNPFQMTFRAKTYENPYNADGSLRFGASTSMNLRQVGNLLEGIRNSQSNQDQVKINGGLSVSYRLLPYLTIKHILGVDFSGDVFTRYINANSFVGSLQAFQSGRAEEASRNVSQIINTSSLIYNQRFNSKHELELGGFFETVRGYQKGLGFFLLNLDPRLTETGQGAGPLPVGVGQTTYPQNATSAKSGFGIRSMFATAKYSFDNRYSVNANIRRDGTSRIVNKDNREVTTWSAGFTWNTFRESFMANQKVLSDLKMRVTYGVVPNIGSIPNGNYGVANRFNITNFQGPQYPSFATANYAGSTVTGLIPTTPGNPDLKIERIQKWNIGVDFGVWNNRARFTVDLYKNKTIDLFVRQPLTASSGFANLDINAGIMTNKGIELSANVDVIRARDFSVNLGLNHAYNKNVIEDLGLVNEYFLGTFVIRRGLPFGSHFTTNYLGADPATGRPLYETQDGKTTTDVAQAGQFAKFGSFQPKHSGGATMEIRYRRVTVSALFSYQFDVVRSDNSRSWVTRGTPGFQTVVRGSRELISGQWQKPGDVKPIQSSLFDRGFTSFDLVDAKFLRFRNLNISYAIPTIKTGGGTVLIKSARFYIQAHNLAIWSPWKGLDPEDNNNISLNEFPNPKMVVVGLDINF